MLNNILATLEFCVYHILVVIASRVSKIQAIGWAKRQDELLRRYLAAMCEIRMLRRELTRVKGKPSHPTLRVRCSQVLAYIFTRGDKIYHKSYLSLSKSAVKNWAYRFRHPIRWRKIQNKGGRPKVTEKIIELILTMKKANGHWGAKRIRDELLKMGIKLSKTTIRNILKDNGYDPFDNNSGKWEKWQARFKDHIWAFDFFFIETFREANCMVFTLIDIYTKEILALQVHEGREGIDTYWVAGTIAQTFAKFKRRPQNLIHDRDRLFLGQVKKMCSVAEIKELIIPPQYPVMNVYCERTIQSIRYELTHHIKAKDGIELQKYLDEYMIWFNNYRPHQAIGGLTPASFSNGETHPPPIPISELKHKKLKRITFADGLLAAYQLVDLKEAA
jgi:transposase InsO family protein